MIRRLAWRSVSPVTDEAVRARLAELGARPWQIDLLAGPAGDRAAAAPPDPSRPPPAPEPTVAASADRLTRSQPVGQITATCRSAARRLPGKKLPIGNTVARHASGARCDEYRH